MSIKLAPGLLEKLEALALNAAPNEACALLMGQGGAVTGFVESPNMTGDDPRRAFEIDPALLLKLHREAREGGPAIAGVWHSHPNGRPVPSDEDRARSVEPGWIWLITGVRDGRCETRMWKAGARDPHRLQEIPLV